MRLRSFNRLLLVLVTLTIVLGMVAGTTHGTMKTMVVGSKWAVSARTPEAALVMAQILEKGGNAFDAAVAGKAVNGLTDASMNATLGADCQILVWHAGLQKVIGINGSGWAPKLATIDWYMENNDGKIPVSDGLLSGTVPADVDAWCTILARWGTMSLEEVLKPALEMAEKGWALRTGISSAKLLAYESSYASIFGHHPAGKEQWSVGEIFTWPDLARTLWKLIEAERANAHKGREAAIMAARDRFYKGDIAREMAEFSEANGGLFRYDDFAEYSVEVVEPVCIDYRGYLVWNSPTASQGATVLFWLNLLRGYDLKSMKHNSPEYIHLMHETMKLAYADREKYLGDWNFHPIPYDVLLSEEYAAERRKLVDMTRAVNEMRPGSVEGFRSSIQETPTSIAGAGDVEEYYIGTSYLCVADKYGNMVSWKPSLHSGWGTGVAMGTTGVVFNCRGDYFELKEDHVNSLQPRKRPRSTLQATLITKDGKPFMVVGSPGGDDQPQREVQTIVNVIDFGMNVQDAIEAPRFSSASYVSSVFPHAYNNPGRITLEGRIPPETVEALKALGHDARSTGDWGVGSALSVILRDPVTGVYYAGADPRNANMALAK
ncbi:MAG: gamma-glutamyltransferase family protein [Firmicutes bacterium]|jgi:gamma-glutamyltranspeptidase/glutathione hydrolase|nr:gamma-glutamyltransferase family protein [Bacillota bacterium]